MSSFNSDYPELHQSNCWNNSGNRQRSNVSQPRTWSLHTNSNVSYSKVAISSARSSTANDTRRTKQWRPLDATLLYSNHKVSNDCDNKNIEISKAKDNTVVRTLQNKNQGLVSVSEASSCTELPRSINNVLPSNESVDNTPDSTNHITSMDNVNDATFEANLEEKRRLRRERQKVKKETKKQEKAIQREEEMRKKRLAPKDQKITIIDHTTLDRFLVKENPSVNVEDKRSSYNGSEFPSLGEVTSSASRSSSLRYQKRKESKKEKAHVGNGASIQLQSAQVLSESPSKSKTSSAQKNSRDLSVDSKLSTSGVATVTSSKKSPENQENKDTKGTDDSKKATKLDDKTTGKRPRRRDPIQLDINEILKVQETRHEVSVKQHISKPAPKTEAVRYAGNILDSDNPERKRGKQREVPKAKKPTALKQIILKERAKRKEIHLQNTFSPTNQDDIKDGSKEENLSNSENSINDEVIVCEKSTATIAYIETKSMDDKENELTPSEACDVNFSKSQGTVENEHTVHLELDAISGIVSDAEGNQNLTEEKESNEYENKMYMEKNEEMIRMEERRKLMLLLNGETIGAQPKSENKTHVPRIHSRKFRDYCDHFVTPDILTAATSLLEDIVKFHDRQYARSPLKASAKRRHVTGLKEVRRFLALRRVRLLIIAPDLEPTTSSGGLDDLVTQLKGSAIANEVPYVFALSRRHLGYILKKKVPVSCVGVLNYEGTELNFRNLMSAVEVARQEYTLRVDELSPAASEPNTEINQVEEAPSNEDDINKEVVASLLAKLAISSPSNVKSTSCPSPFLQAIEQHANTDSDSDENENEEEITKMNRN